jgi:3-oxoadipate enol-lactonase
MPTIKAADGCPINVEVEGDASRPVLMLCNSLGADLHMWDDQVKPFTQAFRLVRYDRRGHGKSGVTQAPYTMEQLGRDALAVMDGLGIKTVNWCGLSMGGMVGMWLGANAPQRVHKLILSNTASYYADKTSWNDRIKLVREKGLAVLAGPTMERWFTKGFREREPKTIERMTRTFLATPVEGYVGCGSAVRDMDHRELLPTIKAPTMIIAGKHDPATTPTEAEYIRSRIPGSKLTLLDAAHVSNVEQPRVYADTVLEFLRA